MRTSWHERPTRAGALAAALVITAIAVALSIGITLAVRSLIEPFGLRLSLTARAVVTVVIVHGMAFSGTAVVYLHRQGARLSSVGWRFPNRRDVGHVIAGWVIALSATIMAAQIVQALGLPLAANKLGVLAAANPELIPTLVVLSLIAVGPAEELLFRGVVQRRLRTAFGPWAAVVLAAALFAGVHAIALVDAWSARLTTIAVLFVPSLVFGALYARTRNLVVPALVHGAYNATLFGGLYVVAS